MLRQIISDRFVQIVSVFLSIKSALKLPAGLKDLFRGTLKKRGYEEAIERTIRDARFHWEARNQSEIKVVEEESGRLAGMEKGARKEERGKSRAEVKGRIGRDRKDEKAKGYEQGVGNNCGLEV